MRKSTGLAAALLLIAGLAGATAARAGFAGGGGGGVSGEGDFALRAELQNPRFLEPGSPYAYYRSYSRGPVYVDPNWAGMYGSVPWGYREPYPRRYRAW